MASSRVDREAKIIHGYSVMSLGEAKGHGFAADRVTLEQLIDLGNAQPLGVKSRIIHPERKADGTSTDRFLAYVGKSKNFRREGDKVVADLHISKAAAVSPEGDYGTYLMERADEDDGVDGFGASPEVRYALAKAQYGPPVMRLKGLDAIAFVDDPATNTGFFSAIKEPEIMADANADLQAERDLLTEEVVRLKAEITTIKADLSAKETAHVAALSTVRTEAIIAERNRVGDIIALCSKANKADLSAKHIADGTAKADLQSALFDVLCATNKAVGEGDNADLSKNTGPDAKYKAEYEANAYLSARMSLEDYIESRKIDDGVTKLTAA